MEPPTPNNRNLNNNFPPRSASGSNQPTPKIQIARKLGPLPSQRSRNGTPRGSQRSITLKEETSHKVPQANTGPSGGQVGRPFSFKRNLQQQQQQLQPMQKVPSAHQKQPFTNLSPSKSPDRLLFDQELSTVLDKIHIEIEREKSLSPPHLRQPLMKRSASSRALKKSPTQFSLPAPSLYSIRQESRNGKSTTIGNPPANQAFKFHGGVNDIKRQSTGSFGDKISPQVPIKTTFSRPVIQSESKQS